MRPYGQYCPIARAAEVLGDRWTLLIARELLLGAHGFNEIERGLPRISRGLLARRLRQLEELGVVERFPGGGGYALTPSGRGLEELVLRLAQWGARWAFGPPREDEIDARLLLWWMTRRIGPAVQVRRRVVVRVDFADDRSWYWLVLEPGRASVCFKNPGFEVDVFLRTDRRTLYEVWLGRRPLRREVAEGRLRLEGDRGRAALVFRLLALLSPVAEAVRAAEAARAVPAPTAAMQADLERRTS